MSKTGRNLQKAAANMRRAMAPRITPLRSFTTGIYDRSTLGARLAAAQLKGPKGKQSTRRFTGSVGLRRAILNAPVVVTYIPPVKRWSGVMIVPDEQWMEEMNSFKRRYNDGNVTGYKTETVDGDDGIWL